jgi:hypothetical protein
MTKTILGLLLIGGAALAEEKPPAELEQLNYFMGTWTCEGKVHAVTPAIKERTITARLVHAAALDGRWSVVNIEEKSSVGVLKMMSLEGWDLATKRFISMGATSSGSSAVATSQGWQGDKLIWMAEGSAFTGNTYKSRMTITKKSATEYDLASEMSSGNGPWKPFREAHCKKEK